MGKRKAKTKSPSKPTKPKLETAFTCPFCNAGTMSFFVWFFFIVYYRISYIHTYIRQYRDVFVGHQHDDYSIII